MKETGISNLQREHRLDALRGIAALCVAAGHCVTAQSIEPQYDKTIMNIDFSNFTNVILRLLHIIFNAEAAVLIFFVLSGYVLTKSLERIEKNYFSEFFNYIIKRAYRIMPSVILSFIPLTFFIDRQGLEYVKNMFLTIITINGSTWTLQVEIIASLLIYLIFIISRKFKFLIIPLFIFLIILFFGNCYAPLFKHLPAFFLGCFINNFRKHIKYEKIILLLSCFFLVTADFYFGYSSKTTILLETVCSVYIIMYASTSDIFRFLDLKIFRYLGEISFSFYLYHLLAAHITLKICASLGIMLTSYNEVVATLLYIGLSIPIAISIGHIAYYLVEKPSVIAGNSVGNNIATNILMIFEK